MEQEIRLISTTSALLIILDCKGNESIEHTYSKQILNFSRLIGCNALNTIKLNHACLRKKLFNLIQVLKDAIR